MLKNTVYGFLALIIIVCCNLQPAKADSIDPHQKHLSGALKKCKGLSMDDAWWRLLNEDEEDDNFSRLRIRQQKAGYTTNFKSKSGMLGGSPINFPHTGKPHPKEKSILNYRACTKEPLYISIGHIRI